jgi:hypothetical protein
MKKAAILTTSLVVAFLLMPLSVSSLYLGDTQTLIEMKTAFTPIKTIKILGESNITSNIQTNLDQKQEVYKISSGSSISTEKTEKDILVVDGVWINDKSMADVKKDIMPKIKDGAPLLIVGDNMEFVESVATDLGRCDFHTPDAIATGLKYYPAENTVAVFSYVGSPFGTPIDNLNASVYESIKWAKEKTTDALPSDSRSESGADNSLSTARVLGSPYWRDPLMNDRFYECYPYGKVLIQNKYYQLMNDPNTANGVEWTVKYHMVGTPGYQLFVQNIKYNNQQYRSSTYLDWFVMENHLDVSEYWHLNDAMVYDLNSQKYEPQTTVGVTTTTYNMGIGLETITAGISTSITTPNQMVEWQGREYDEFARWWFNIDELTTYAHWEKSEDAVLNAHCPGMNGDPWGGYTEYYPTWGISWYDINPRHYRSMSWSWDWTAFPVRY